MSSDFLRMSLPGRVLPVARLGLVLAFVLAVGAIGRLGPVHIGATAEAAEAHAAQSSSTQAATSPLADTLPVPEHAALALATGAGDRRTSATQRFLIVLIIVTGGAGLLTVAAAMRDRRQP